MDGEVVSGDIIHPDGSIDRVVTEVHVTAGTVHSILNTLKSIVQYIAGLCLLAGAGLVIYQFGYFLARGLEWKRPPQVQLYEKYNSYRMYEDGSYQAEYRDGTKIKGCITDALCND